MIKTKKIATILEIRQVVRSILIEIMMTSPPAKTEPASNTRAKTNIAPGQATPSTSINPNAAKAAEVVKILSSKGEILAPEAIQAWMKTQDPANVSSKSAAELATAYALGSTTSSVKPEVGTPTLKQGDFDREQNIKTKQQTLFDKYSTPLEKFK